MMFLLVNIFGEDHVTEIMYCHQLHFLSLVEHANASDISEPIHHKWYGYSIQQKPVKFV